MNHIKIDPTHSLGTINRDIFGGFAEHLGRCIYGGIYDPGSPHADANGLRRDVLDALHRLKMPVIRYPGGNFASGYRWMDGVGPREQRPTRIDLAWHDIDSNHFGTNEFIQFCRELGSEPYLAVNCGDGDMREARDWVEYCNGTDNTALAKLRRSHGYDAPHAVKYWGIGNEVDGPWQIGAKTAQEYARAFTEYAKVMRWVDPSIKLFASALSFWEVDWVERAQLLIEQAGEMIDYMAIHWYVGHPDFEFADFMAISEGIEERLSAYEGLLKALRMNNKLKRPIPIAVDEWNVWYRTAGHFGKELNRLEERYNLEDALIVGMHFNAFIRHAQAVQMANIAQIVNVIAPIFTRPDGLYLQTIFYPFELYSQTCGKTALHVHWHGDTFEGGGYTGIRTLDVSATLDEDKRQLALYVINRSQDTVQSTTIQLIEGQFAGAGTQYLINGPDVKAENSFEAQPVITRQSSFNAEGSRFSYEFEPHSVTALVLPIR